MRAEPKLLEEREYVAEFRRAGFVEHLVDGGLGGREKDARLRHLPQGGFRIALGPRGDRIDRDVDLVVLGDEVVGGLADADVGLDPAKEDLAAAGALHLGAEGVVAEAAKA